MKIEDLKKDLENTFEKENIKYDEPMSKHTSFKVGGTAEIFIKIKSAEEMQKLLEINDNNFPITVVGNGSNLLVTDNGIRGIVVRYIADDFEITGNQVVASAGILNSKLAINLMKTCLSGFEFASGIPGTLGGAIYMNAGAYSNDMKNIVKEVTFLDLEDKKIYTIKGKECNFTYRSSIFEKKNTLILNALLELKNDTKENIEKRMKDYKEKRMSTQPYDKPSAGSTFKRGENYITAKLIEDAGLKGAKIGGAEVSLKHSGFIINNGGATAKDIIDLIDYVQEEVYKKYGKKIKTEVRIIGQ